MSTSGPSGNPSAIPPSQPKHLGNTPPQQLDWSAAAISARMAALANTPYDSAVWSAERSALEHENYKPLVAPEAYIQVAPDNDQNIGVRILQAGISMHTALSGKKGDHALGMNQTVDTSNPNNTKAVWVMANTGKAKDQVEQRTQKVIGQLTDTDPSKLDKAHFLATINAQDVVAGNEVLSTVRCTLNNDELTVNRSGRKCRVYVFSLAGEKKHEFNKFISAAEGGKPPIINTAEEDLEQKYTLEEGNLVITIDSEKIDEGDIAKAIKESQGNLFVLEAKLLTLNNNIKRDKPTPELSRKALNIHLYLHKPSEVNKNLDHQVFQAEANAVSAVRSSLHEVFAIPEGPNSPENARDRVKTLDPLLRPSREQVTAGEKLTQQEAAAPEAPKGIWQRFKNKFKGHGLEAVVIAPFKAAAEGVHALSQWKAKVLGWQSGDSLPKNIAKAVVSTALIAPELMATVATVLPYAVSVVVATGIKTVLKSGWEGLKALKNIPLSFTKGAKEKRLKELEKFLDTANLPEPAKSLYQKLPPDARRNALRHLRSINQAMHRVQESEKIQDDHPDLVEEAEFSKEPKLKAVLHIVSRIPLINQMLTSKVSPKGTDGKALRGSDGHPLTKTQWLGSINAAHAIGDLIKKTDAMSDRLEVIMKVDQGKDQCVLTKDRLAKELLIIMEQFATEAIVTGSKTNDAADQERIAFNQELVKAKSATDRALAASFATDAQFEKCLNNADRKEALDKVDAISRNIAAYYRATVDCVEGQDLSNQVALTQANGALETGDIEALIDDVRQKASTEPDGAIKKRLEDFCNEAETVAKRIFINRNANLFANNPTLAAVETAMNTATPDSYGTTIAPALKVVLISMNRAVDSAIHELRDLRQNQPNEIATVKTTAQAIISSELAQIEAIFAPALAAGHIQRADLDAYKAAVEQHYTTQLTALSTPDDATASFVTQLNSFANGTREVEDLVTVEDIRPQNELMVHETENACQEALKQYLEQIRADGNTEDAAEAALAALETIADTVRTVIGNQPALRASPEFEQKLRILVAHYEAEVERIHTSRARTVDTYNRSEVVGYALESLERTGLPAFAKLVKERVVLSTSKALAGKAGFAPSLTILAGATASQLARNMAAAHVHEGVRNALDLNQDAADLVELLPLIEQKGSFLGVVMPEKVKSATDGKEKIKWLSDTLSSVSDAYGVRKVAAEIHGLVTHITEKASISTEEIAQLKAANKLLSQLLGSVYSNTTGVKEDIGGTMLSRSEGAEVIRELQSYLRGLSLGLTADENKELRKARLESRPGVATYLGSLAKNGAWGGLKESFGSAKKFAKFAGSTAAAWFFMDLAMKFDVALTHWAADKMDHVTDWIAKKLPDFIGKHVSEHLFTELMHIAEAPAAALGWLGSSPTHFQDAGGLISGAIGIPGRIIHGTPLVGDSANRELHRANQESYVRLAGVGREALALADRITGGRASRFIGRPSGEGQTTRPNHAPIQRDGLRPVPPAPTLPDATRPGETPAPTRPGETPIPTRPGETPIPTRPGETPTPTRPGETPAQRIPPQVIEVLSRPAESHEYTVRTRNAASDNDPLTVDNNRGREGIIYDDLRGRSMTGPDGQQHQIPASLAGRMANILQHEMNSNADFRQLGHSRNNDKIAIAIDDQGRAVVTLTRGNRHVVVAMAMEELVSRAHPRSSELRAMGVVAQAQTAPNQRAGVRGQNAGSSEAGTAERAPAARERNRDRTRRVASTEAVQPSPNATRTPEASRPAPTAEVQSARPTAQREVNGHRLATGPSYDREALERPILAHFGIDSDDLLDSKAESATAIDSDDRDDLIRQLRSIPALNTEFTFGEGQHTADGNIIEIQSRTNPNSYVHLKVFEHEDVYYFESFGSNRATGSFAEYHTQPIARQRFDLVLSMLAARAHNVPTPTRADQTSGTPNATATRPAATAERVGTQPSTAPTDTNSTLAIRVSNAMIDDEDRTEYTSARVDHVRALTERATRDHAIDTITTTPAANNILYAEHGDTVSDIRVRTNDGQSAIVLHLTHDPDHPNVIFAQAVNEGTGRYSAMQTRFAQPMHFEQVIGLLARQAGTQPTERHEAPVETARPAVAAEQRWTAERFEQQANLATAQATNDIAAALHRGLPDNLSGWDVTSSRPGYVTLSYRNTRGAHSIEIAVAPNTTDNSSPAHRDDFDARVTATRTGRTFARIGRDIHGTPAQVVAAIINRTLRYSGTQQTRVLTSLETGLDHLGEAPAATQPATTTPGTGTAGDTRAEVAATVRNTPAANDTATERTTTEAAVRPAATVVDLNAQRARVRAAVESARQQLAGQATGTDGGTTTRTETPRADVRPTPAPAPTATPAPEARVAGTVEGLMNQVTGSRTPEVLAAAERARTERDAAAQTARESGTQTLAGEALMTTRREAIATLNSVSGLRARSGPVAESIVLSNPDNTQQYITVRITGVENGRVMGRVTMSTAGLNVDHEPHPLNEIGRLAHVAFHPTASERPTVVDIRRSAVAGFTSVTPMNVATMDALGAPDRGREPGVRDEEIAPVANPVETLRGLLNQEFTNEQAGRALREQGRYFLGFIKVGRTDEQRRLVEHFNNGSFEIMRAAEDIAEQIRVLHNIPGYANVRVIGAQEVIEAIATDLARGRNIEVEDLVDNLGVPTSDRDLRDHPQIQRIVQRVHGICRIASGLRLPEGSTETLRTELVDQAGRIGHLSTSATESYNTARGQGQAGLNAMLNFISDVDSDNTIERAAGTTVDPSIMVRLGRTGHSGTEDNIRTWLDERTRNAHSPAEALAELNRLRESGEAYIRNQATLVAAHRQARDQANTELTRLRSASGDHAAEIAALEARIAGEEEFIAINTREFARHQASAAITVGTDMAHTLNEHQVRAIRIGLVKEYALQGRDVTRDAPAARTGERPAATSQSVPAQVTPELSAEANRLISGINLPADLNSMSHTALVQARTHLANEMRERVYRGERLTPASLQLIERMDATMLRQDLAHRTAVDIANRLNSERFRNSNITVSASEIERHLLDVGAGGGIMFTNGDPEGGVGVGLNVRPFRITTGGGRGYIEIMSIQAGGGITTTGDGNLGVSVRPIHWEIRVGSEGNTTIETGAIAGIHLTGGMAGAYIGVRTYLGGGVDLNVRANAGVNAGFAGGVTPAIGAMIGLERNTPRAFEGARRNLFAATQLRDPNDAQPDIAEQRERVLALLPDLDEDLAGPMHDARVHELYTMLQNAINTQAHVSSGPNSAVAVAGGGVAIGAIFDERGTIIGFGPYVTLRIGSHLEYRFVPGNREAKFELIRDRNAEMISNLRNNRHTFTDPDGNRTRTAVLSVEMTGSSVGIDRSGELRPVMHSSRVATTGSVRVDTPRDLTTTVNNFLRQTAGVRITGSRIAVEQPRANVQYRFMSFVPGITIQANSDGHGASFSRSADVQNFSIARRLVISGPAVTASGRSNVEIIAFLPRDASDDQLQTMLTNATLGRTNYVSVDPNPGQTETALYFNRSPSLATTAASAPTSTVAGSTTMPTPAPEAPMVVDEAVDELLVGRAVESQLNTADRALLDRVFREFTHRPDVIRGLRRHANVTRARHTLVDASNQRVLDEVAYNAEIQAYITNQVHQLIGPNENFSERMNWATVLAALIPTTNVSNIIHRSVSYERAQLERRLNAMNWGEGHTLTPDGHRLPDSVQTGLNAVIARLRAQVRALPAEVRVGPQGGGQAIPEGFVVAFHSTRDANDRRTTHRRMLTTREATVRSVATELRPIREYTGNERAAAEYLFERDISAAYVESQTARFFYNTLSAAERSQLTQLNNGLSAPEREAVRQLSNGGRHMTAEQRQLAQAAMARLSPEQRTFLAGIYTDFHRNSEALRVAARRGDASFTLTHGNNSVQLALNSRIVYGVHSGGNNPYAAHIGNCGNFFQGANLEIHGPGEVPVPPTPNGISFARDSMGVDNQTQATRTPGWDLVLGFAVGIRSTETPSEERVGHPNARGPNMRRRPGPSGDHPNAEDPNPRQ
ncbi:MAG: hypothetical protein HY817_04460 [Candidatus Abawacabacteria bacterium]|nr:hypothetical protein [Candidatus Abawacabacteria bacterium]